VRKARLAFDDAICRGKLQTLHRCAMVHVAVVMGHFLRQSGGLGRSQKNGTRAEEAFTSVHFLTP
jgi:hypothetical protein